jgi:predicted nucleic acid-binding protein
VFSKLFVDTSAFYALEDASDRHHGEAQAIHAWCLHSRPLLFTTHHVMDESITLLGGRLRPAHAARFARRLLTSRAIHLVRTDEALEHAALIVYERLDDARLSFTDCVSFAVMHALDIPAAFAFDHDFERAGFQRLYARDL